MLGYLSSAFAALFRWLITGTGIASLLTVGMGFLLTAGMTILLPLIPGMDGIAQKMASIPTDVMWFVDLFAVPQCMTIAMGILVGRFILRRIPFIG